MVEQQTVMQQVLGSIPTPNSTWLGLTQPSIPLWVGKMRTSKHRVGQHLHLSCMGCKLHADLNHRESKAAHCPPKRQRWHIKEECVIYRYKCGRVDCEDEYIWESGRTFAESFREHLWSPSPIYDHFKTTGHESVPGQFQHCGQG